MKGSSASSRTPAVLVIGLPGSGKSTFIRRHARGFRRRPEIVPVDDAEVLARRLRTPAGRPVVFEARGPLEPLDLLDVFDDPGCGEHFYLSDVVAVVDASRFFREFREHASDEGSDQTPGERLVNQIELASAVALEKAGPLRDRAGEARIRDVIRALNPTARLDGIGWDYASAFDLSLSQRDAPWLRIPPPGSVAVDVFHYRARRPFHPARLAVLLESGWTGMLRTKGFVWIASRGEERGVYIQTGRTWRLDAAGPWWASIPQGEWPTGEDDLADIRTTWNVRTGDRRQELVFVGLNLHRQRIRQDLDACLLGPREYAAGPAAWRALPDPLPSWDGDGPEEQARPAPVSAGAQPLAVD